MAGAAVGDLVTSLLVMASPGQPPLVQLLVEAGDGLGDPTEILSKGTIRMQGSEASGSIREAPLHLMEIPVQAPHTTPALRCVPERPGFLAQLPQLAKRASFSASRVPGVSAGMVQQVRGQLVESNRRVQYLVPGAVDRRRAHALRPV